MNYVHQDWPAMLYRVTDAGVLEGKVFDSAESVEGGYERHNPEMDARAADLKAKAPKPSASVSEPKGDAAKIKALEKALAAKDEALKVALEGEKKANAEADALDETLTKANTIIEELQKKVAELESAAKADVNPGATEAKPAPSAKPKATPKA